MDEILRTVLNRLDRIGRSQQELYDSDVRQAMGNAVMDGFVRSKGGASLQADFGMFSEDAKSAVKSALEDYVAAATEMAASLGICQFNLRMSQLQNAKVCCLQGNYCDDFFGHSPPEYFGANGNFIRTN